MTCGNFLVVSEYPIPPPADREIRCLSCVAPSGAALLERIPSREIWDRLRPGGFLCLSVPNRMRSRSAQLAPLDCPPHHLTRWSPASLATIARRSGLLPAEVATEPVEVSTPRDRLRERIRDGVGKVSAVGRLLGTWFPLAAWRAVFFPPLLTIYQRHGVLERAEIFGLSVAVCCVETPS